MNVFTKTILALGLASTAALSMANTVTAVKPTTEAAAVQAKAAQPKTAQQGVTVKQALSLKDDSKVQVTGYIVKSLGDEKYQFRDSTGSITVEIDDKLLHGKKISAKTPVTLMGEVDVDHKANQPVKVEIEVDHVKI